MSRPPKLSHGACAELAEWFRNYQRIGTFAEKAKECGVSEQTLRNAIDRGLGKDDSNMRQKLSAADIDELAERILSTGST
jgi:hypothetical protein